MGVLAIVCCILVVGCIVLFIHMQNTESSIVAAKEEQLADLPTDPKERMEQLAAILPTLPQKLQAVALWQAANDALVVDEHYAEEYFSKLIQRADKPLSFIATITKAQLLIALGRAADAIQVLRAVQGFATAESEQVYLLTLAQAQEDARYKDDAVKTYKKIIAIDASMRQYAQYRLEQLKE